MLGGGNLIRLLIGDGFWVHRVTLVEPFEEVFNKYLSGVRFSIVRTTGFSAFLTDTGIMGVLLLGVNFLLAAREISRGKGSLRHRLIIMLALLMVVLWLFTANILDILLLYMVIMPSGLLAQLAKYGQTEQPMLRPAKVGYYKLPNGEKA